VLVVIEGSDLPGRRCGPSPEGRWYENIHVGLGRPPKLVGLVPGDAPSARWELEITMRRRPGGELDFRGPFVHGKRGERSLYLSWGEVADDGAFELFRAAKLRFSDLDPDLVRQAMEPGRRLVGRLGLTDSKGHPRCARVRPPDIEWSAEADTPTKAG
jgi:hypothetical protein